MVTINKGTIVAHYKRFQLLPEEQKKEPDKYLYEIIGLAINCTDSEKTMVVYRALYGDRMLFVRTVDDFTSYVREAGRYRFEPWTDQ